MSRAETEEEKVPGISVGIGERIYLVPFERIDAIQEAPVVIPVPDSSQEVIGITVYEGQTVAYLRLDEERTLSSAVKCGILLKYGDGRRIGMAVDEIGDMCEISRQELKEQAEGLKYQIWREILG